MVSSIYVNSLACVRVKRGKSECFRINSGVRQGCIMSLWLFIDAVMRDENVDGEEGSDISGGGKRVESAWPPVCR